MSIQVDWYMTNMEVLQTAFQNVAGHISNLDEIRSIVELLEQEYSSIQDITQAIESRISDAEVTLRTDMRILLNEIRHLSGRGSKQ